MFLTRSQFTHEINWNENNENHTKFIQVPRHQGIVPEVWSEISEKNLEGLFHKENAIFLKSKKQQSAKNLKKNGKH